MQPTEEQVQRMAALYDGLDRAYGQYTTNSTPNPETGKLEGQALTVKDMVTPELWHAHLSGEQSLGIVPIDDNGMVSFAVIDIDDYGFSLETIKQVVRDYQLPMLCLHSKSGGFHLTAFFKEKVPAKFAKKQVSCVLKLLGSPKADLFPRQVKLANENDVGNWINMPYFGDTRKLVSGKSLDAFLDMAEAMQATQKEWAALG